MKFLPSRRQFSKWSLPTKWGFVAAVVGLLLLPVTLIDIDFVRKFIIEEKAKVIAPDKAIIYSAAHEMQYNIEWLLKASDLAKSQSRLMPMGVMRTEATMRILDRNYRKVTKYSYGEEEDIGSMLKLYQASMDELNSLSSIQDFRNFNKKYELSIDDCLVLTGFLNWYFTPLYEDHLDQVQLGSLPNMGSIVEQKIFEDVKLKYFVFNDEAVDSFSSLLGYLD
ncbi:MAG: hypothetical protein JKX94_08015 [Sneathiella sp.]|nr:hypothetical protein [Sneathiella sp.]